MVYKIWFKAIFFLSCLVVLLSFSVSACVYVGGNWQVNGSCNVSDYSTGTYDGTRLDGQTGSFFGNGTPVGTSTPRIDIPSLTYINSSTTNFTFNIWTLIGVKHSSLNYGFICKQQSACLGVEGGNLKFGMRNSTTGIINAQITSSFWMVDELIMLTGVYNGTHIAIYKNATFFTATALPSGFQTQNSAQNFDIGRWVISGNNNASLKNDSNYKVTIHLRALEVSEVASEYSLGPNSLTTNLDGLVLQYCLNCTGGIYSNSSHVFNVNRTVYDLGKGVSRVGVYDGTRQGGQTGSSFAAAFDSVSTSQNINNSMFISQTLIVNFKVDNRGGAGIGSDGRQQIVSVLNNWRLQTLNLTTASNVLQFYVSNTTHVSPVINFNSLNLTLGQEYQVTLVFNSSDIIAYLNGVNVQNRSHSVSYSSVGGSVILGGSQGDFNGSIYKVYLLSKGLTASEAASQYALSANTPTNLTNDLVLQFLLNRSEDVFSNASTVFNVRNFEGYNVSFDGVIKTGVYDGTRAGTQSGMTFDSNTSRLNTGLIYNFNEATLMCVWPTIFANNTGDTSIVQHLIGMYPGSAPQFTLEYLESNRHFRMVSRNTTTLLLLNIGSFGSISFNTQYQVCGAQLVNDTMYVFLNGEFVSSGEGAFGSIFSSTHQVTIGGSNRTEPTVSNNLNGTITKAFLVNLTLGGVSTYEALLALVVNDYERGPNAPTSLTDGLVLQYLLNRSEDVFSNSTDVFNVITSKEGIIDGFIYNFKTLTLYNGYSLTARGGARIG